MPGPQEVARLLLQITADTGQARANLTSFAQQVRDLDGTRAQVKVQTNADRVGNAVKDVSDKLKDLEGGRGGGGGPRLVDIIGDDELKKLKDASERASLFGEEVGKIKDEKINVEVDVDTSQLRMLQSEFQNIGRFTDIQAPNVSPQLGLFGEQLQVFEQRLRDLDGENVEVDVHLNTPQDQLALFESQLSLLDRNVELDVEVNDHGQIALFQRELQDLGSFTPHFEGGGGQVQALGNQLNALGGQMDDIDHRHVEPNIDVDTAGSQLKLDILSAQLSALDAKDVKVKVDTSRANLLGDMTMAVRGLVSGLQSFAGAGEQAASSGGLLGKSVANASVNVGGMSLRLTGLVALIGTAVIATMVALAAAAASVAAALALAAAAVAGMIGAGLAMLAPIAAVALPAFLSLSKVMKVLQQRQTEEGQAAAKSARDHQAASQYADQHADAVRNLQRAIENQAQTEADSDRQIAEARRSRQQAIQDLASAEQSAYREMQDAAERARDAELSLQRARLSREEANLGLKEAIKNLKDFRKQTGTAANALDGMFTKFSNVNFKGNTANIVGQIEAATGKSFSGDKELELQRLVLAVKDARLRQKEATDGVGDSQRELNRAQEDNNKFLRDGIKASDNYKAALERVRDARKAVTDAERTASRAEVAAARQVADARRNIGRVETARAFEVQNQQLTNSQSKVDALNASERHLLDTVTRLKTAMGTAFGPSTTAILDGIAGGLDKVEGPMKTLQPMWTRLGQAIGTGIQNLAAALTSPQMLGFWKTFAGGAVRAIPSVISILTSLLTLFLQFTSSALPYFIVLLQDLATGLTDAANNGGGFSGMFQAAKPIIDAVWRIFKAFVGIFLGFVKAGAGQGGSLLDTFAGWAEKISAFVNSAQGTKEIQDFLATVLPLARSFGRFLFALVGFFLRLGEAAAPTLSIIFDVLTIIVGVLSTVVNAIGTLINIAARPLAALTELGTQGIGLLLGMANQTLDVGKSLVTGLVNGIEAGITWVKNAVADLWDSIWRAITGLFGIGSPSTKFASAGKDLVRGLINGIGSLIGDVVGKIAELATNAWNAVHNRLVRWRQAGVDWVKNLISGIASWVGSLVTRVADLATQAWTAVRDKVAQWFNLGVDFVKGIIEGVKNKARGLKDAVVKTAKDAWQGVKDFLHIGSPSRVMMDVGWQIGRGLEEGINSSADRVARAATRSLAAPTLAAASVGVGPGTRGGTTIQSQQVILPAAPGYAGLGDPRVAATEFAREMKRRGGS